MVDASLRGTKPEIPLPFAGTPWPQVFPLILFGVVTALAWTTSQRATARIASIEATRILAKGVQLGDIADMWELKANFRWLKWRKIMWRSSVIGIVSLILYLAASLTVRLLLVKTVSRKPFHFHDCSRLTALHCW